MTWQFLDYGPVLYWCYVEKQAIKNDLRGTFGASFSVHPSPHTRGSYTEQYCRKWQVAWPVYNLKLGVSGHSESSILGLMQGFCPKDCRLGLIIQGSDSQSKLHIKTTWEALQKLWLPGLHVIMREWESQVKEPRHFVFVYLEAPPNDFYVLPLEAQNKGILLTELGSCPHSTCHFESSTGSKKQNGRCSNGSDFRTTNPLCRLVETLWGVQQSVAWLG